MLILTPSPEVFPISRGHKAQQAWEICLLLRSLKLLVKLPRAERGASRSRCWGWWFLALGLFPITLLCPTHTHLHAILLPCSLPRENAEPRAPLPK